MSDTAVTPTNQTAPAANPDGMILDGEMPRLGSAPIIPPAPMGGAGTPVTSDPPAPAPSAPVVSPVLTATDAPMHPDEPRDATDAPAIPQADMPSLPTAAPSAPTTTTTTNTTTADGHDATTETVDGHDATTETAHPMAHLMPPKSKPTEASIRAAEKRAVKKAKAKKVKIGVAIGALVFTVLAGPPFVSWLTNAINESGGLNTEEPAD